MERIMQNRATMFFDNVTDLDCAVINNGKVVGRSFRIAAEVTGPIQTEEQVVIDFSACKKEMKRLIDDAELGFDHKFIACTKDDLDGAYARKPNGTERSYISADAFSAIGDTHMFNIIDSQISEDILTSLRKAIEQMLTKGLEKLMDLDEGDIEVNLNKLDPLEVTALANRLPFNYVHGLKNSTSFGCQNILHGHSSFIEAFDFDGLHVPLSSLLDIFDIPFDYNVVVTTSDNVTTTGETTVIGYESKSRGMFKMETTQDVWVLNYPDTTVENLAHYIAIQNRDSLLRNKISRIRVSEGLSKGAVVRMCDI